MEPTQASLLGLSTELLFHIINYVHPSSHLSLALTCSKLHRHSQAILARHRAAHSIVSDHQPETVLELLRGAETCSVELWHVQELELWGNRSNWEEWRPWDVSLTGLIRLADTEPIEANLPREEIMGFFSMAKQWWDIPEDEFDAARNELETGGDGFLKLLLIASCPRLHSIRFAKEKERDMHTSLRWMAKAVSWSMDSGRWPPGFQSLRNVAIGVSTGAPREEEEQDHGGFQLEFMDFAAVFNLPGIHSLYISDLYPDWEEEGQDDEDSVMENYRLEPHSSTIQHIYIDRAQGLQVFYHPFLGVSKDLQSMTLRGLDNWMQCDDTDVIPEALSKHYPDTFRKMTFYSPGGLHGYRCGVYMPDAIREPFPGMRQVSVGISDIDLMAMAEIDSKPNIEAYVEFWCEPFLPENLEVIMIWGEPGRGDDWLELDDDVMMDFIDAAIAAVIRTGTYKNLKVIYLDDIERQTETQRPRICFQKAIAAGREMGVHVCTLTNREDGGYWREFPAAADKFDLKTGPFGERPTSWRINRREGVWEDPGCEGCGECEECLRVYPEHVWKSAAVSLSEG
ncbi:hypothetical protein CEP54_009135 [Fusarium duplospermum]|uniref:Uncharacterized protein n=1 Tax=Fusarium duplospermum TaxID=1325734 RepID=A0A428PSC1_9HYPO|nr:hypothetical protein CEP54_009135 [Fusarium duplospermum]